METVASFPDAASAEAAAALLRSHSISVFVEPGDSFGQAISPTIQLVVAPEDVRRVEWVVATSDLSDSEYFFLTTRELVSEQEAASALAVRRRARAWGPTVAILALGGVVCAVLVEIFRRA